MVKQIAILQANKTGNKPEIFIHDRLKREGYYFVYLIKDLVQLGSLSSLFILDSLKLAKILY